MSLHFIFWHALVLIIFIFTIVERLWTRVRYAAGFPAGRSADISRHAHAKASGNPETIPGPGHLAPGREEPGQAEPSLSGVEKTSWGRNGASEKHPDYGFLKGPGVKPRLLQPPVPCAPQG